MSIGQVSDRAGVAASAIRFYERQGLVPRAARLGGRRVYDPSILLRLEVIGLAKAAGFSIAEIRELLKGVSRKTAPGVRWRKMAKAKASELDRRIDEARRMRAVLDLVRDCTCPSFEDCARAARS